METRPASESLSEREFEKISDHSCGIDLRNGKRQARLGKIIHQGHFESFKQYNDSVVADKTGQELIFLLDRLTTNFTSFLREATHCEFLMVRRANHPTRKYPYS